jgi:TPR repeat protein
MRAMIRARLLAAGILALIATLASSSGLIAQEPAEVSYSLALEARSHREYPLMIFHLERAARQGHLSAQERLGIALLAGESLYGNVPRDFCGAVRWFRRAGAQGSEVGKAHNEMLSHLDSTRACQ